MKAFNKVLILINSEGKKRIIDDFIDFLHNHFQEHINSGFFILYKTVDPTSTKVISKDFSQKYEKSLIVAVGGDGTIHEIVNSINFDNTSLAVIPNGTGNDFASHLYGEIDRRDIFKKLLNPNFFKADVIRINDYYCMNVTSFGYDTVVLKKSLELKEKFPFLRNFSFKLAVPLTISKIEPVNYTYDFIDVNDNHIKGKGGFILNAICNGSRFGGGFKPAPEAKINDGIIEINQVDNMSLRQSIGKIASYTDGSHINKIKESHNYKVVSGKIKPDGEKIFGNIDGELYEFDEIDFEIIPGRINLMY